MEVIMGGNDYGGKENVEMFCLKSNDVWCAPKGWAAEAEQKKMDGMENTAIIAKYRNDPIFCNDCMKAYAPSLDDADKAMFDLLCPATPTASPTEAETSPESPTGSESGSTSVKLSGLL